MLSKNNQATVCAYEKGYRVIDNLVYSSNNKLVKLRTKKQGNYKVFSVSFEGKSKPVLVHKLVAYQKYGTAVFEKGIHVHHLNNNPEDNSFNNIAIGTAQDNNLDKPVLDRIYYARQAHRKFTDEFLNQLKNDYQNGLTYRDLRNKYNISSGSLSYHLSKTSKRQSLKNFTHIPFK